MDTATIEDLRDLVEAHSVAVGSGDGDTELPDGTYRIRTGTRRATATVAAPGVEWSPDPAHDLGEVLALAEAVAAETDPDQWCYVEAVPRGERHARRWVAIRGTGAHLPAEATPMRGADALADAMASQLREAYAEIRRLHHLVIQLTDSHVEGQRELTDRTWQLGLALADQGARRWDQAIEALSPALTAAAPIAVPQLISLLAGALGQPAPAPAPAAAPSTDGQEGAEPAEDIDLAIERWRADGLAIAGAIAADASLATPERLAPLRDELAQLVTALDAMLGQS